MQRNQYSEFAKEIISRLSMFGVWAKYCNEPIKRDFVNCPFHAENTASMKIYPGNKGYYCFGCHEGGDVINFVRKMFNLSFTQAIIRLDNDFNLGLPLNRRLTPREAYLRNKRVNDLQEQRKRRQGEIRALDTAYWTQFYECSRLEDNMRDYAPKTMGEEWHPLFIEALKNIAYQKYLLECADIERYVING